MYKTKGIKNSRIDVADGLRGLAVAGIILYHSVEHFNMFARDIAHSLPFDGKFMDILTVLLSGKMYGIFAMLFGLSFFIQRDNQEQKGRDFSLRFAWRMFLLLIFGIINTAFYDGDILVTYAILGVLLIPAGYFSNALLWTVTCFLLVQPFEIYSLITGWVPEFAMRWQRYGEIGMVHANGTFWDSLLINLKYAQSTDVGWCFMKGRITQTLGLFYLGLLFGRYRLFYDEGNHRRIWRIICAVSAALVTVGSIVDFGSLDNFLHPIYNLMILFFIVSGVVLLWYRFKGFRKGFSHMCFFGRMSLSNYLMQSIIGSFLFYGWGLGLYNQLGTTYSFLVGIGIVLFQYTLLYFWSRKHQRGPVETVWRNLTWLGSK